MSADINSEAKCINAGMNNFGKIYLVQKPIILNALKDIIDNVS